MSRHEDQIAFRLPRQIVAKLDRAAKRAGRSRSELLRDAVASYLEQLASTSSRASEPSRAWDTAGEGVRSPETLERIVRAGVRALQTKPYCATTFSMGEPRVPSLDKSLRIAAELEDEETARKLSLRK
jgi:predicted transcriptional regulator